MAVTVEIADVDYAPRDLHEQAPFRATLLRKMRGDDRPDYWLAELERPLLWEETAGSRRKIDHLILCSRYEGATISDEMDRLVVGIAYVTDDSVLDDTTLDFDKCRYIAVGTLTTKPDVRE